jgi:hypothetical protein
MVSDQLPNIENPMDGCECRRFGISRSLLIGQVYLHQLHSGVAMLWMAKIFTL